MSKEIEERLEASRSELKESGAPSIAGISSNSWASPAPAVGLDGWPLQPGMHKGLASGSIRFDGWGGTWCPSLSGNTPLNLLPKPQASR